ncbi:lipopolysaccharide biosynthesis protein [Pedobacter sp. L105]|uniref:lipopolysaccharide biosynthesis protein n=1 Tax=Pedobacter sp. L105 TaxID=1641871 RepID=UPI00131D8633|nr:MATE family efflux transporter [Pedobacter sp. L105]
MTDNFDSDKQIRAKSKIDKLLGIVLSKDQKSKLIQINTILTMLFRGLGILCSFLIVPLTLGYLNKDNYGAWLTLSSIISWLSFMDVGLGNGLRNKLAEAIAIDDRELAKQYISTTYFVFSLVMIALILVFSLINPFLNWDSILKINIPNKNLILLTYIVIITFCIRLVLELVGIIMISLQRPFVKAMIDFSISSLSLLSVYILIKSSTPSFVLFGSVICIMPIIVLIIFSYSIFNKKSIYSYLSPSIKYFRKIHIHSLLNLGLQFFVIQLAVLIIFSTDNILITQLFSSAEVSSFNIAYKYFSISTLVFSIVVLPYWSAFTTAFLKNDTLWIKGAFKKLLTIWFLQVGGVLLLIFTARIFYQMWVGDSVHIPMALNWYLGFYVIIYNWNNIFAYFLNGVSKIKLQLFSAIFVGLINIPLSYYLSKHTNLGVSAIALSNCICLSITAIWAPVQCYKIVNNTARGLWNR